MEKHNLFFVEAEIRLVLALQLELVALLADSGPARALGAAFAALLLGIGELPIEFCYFARLLLERL